MKSNATISETVETTTVTKNGIVSLRRTTVVVEEVAGTSPTTPPGFKTQLCTHFAAGACKHGAKCSFAHGAAELQAGGGGKAAPLPAEHRTRLCRNFLSAGGCRAPALPPLSSAALGAHPSRTRGGWPPTSAAPPCGGFRRAFPAHAGAGDHMGLAGLARTDGRRRCWQLAQPPSHPAITHKRRCLTLPAS